MELKITAHKYNNKSVNFESKFDNHNNRTRDFRDNSPYPVNTINKRRKFNASRDYDEEIERSYSCDRNYHNYYNREQNLIKIMIFKIR